MAISVLQTTSTTFEHCLSVIRQASVEILLLLKVPVSEGKDPRWFLEQLDQARLNLGGWNAVAKRLHMNDAQLSQFTLRLRHLQQCIPQYDNCQDVSENQLIAALRFVTALEELRQHQPLLNYHTEVEESDSSQQRRAQRQLRTIELVLKGLVAQVWPNKQALNGYLKQHFGVDRLRAWIKQGNGQDALSGMRFSELALMVVDKKTFARHYAAIFDDASVLTLFAEPRTTLRQFLDDCRQARNVVIANERLTEAQLTLLACQYQHITRPVQRAFERGRTRVNPASLMVVDEEQLEQYWESVRQKDRLTGGDPLEIGETIDPPRKHPQRTAEEREQLISGALWGAVGVLVLVVLGGGFWLFSTQGPAPAQRIEIIQNEPKREAPSARETVTHMGITWDTFSLRAAIDRNDTRVTALFLQGGMNWQLAWTEQAFALGNVDVLQLLLRYPSQMDEPKPCRRFINTLGYAMLNGAKLTAEHKAYLQRFCTVPAVVTRQQYDAEQARLRARAEPSADNKKWQKIQAEIYDEIHG
ncbi:hypothetical protein C3432_21010 [Citrobacter amalonaticus]|uniref:STY4199-like HEPN domain-containing protein n=1 Tax=Citrobacter amalonaticus TaxID=35703 RepID=A0A2S4RUY3_CITAM|nr:STY4199 family HEPN domain-containing protein [Citrobacter amalonaticus]POT55535.1 hypothetical protein C3432_21010 [Citrobacter amalonaticus]POT73746.1 hypothetical protein C3436_18475 [Citrobacter amalonaticus]POU63971.1 hypothetical protein C3430_17410 [Citrobacter amalonaticus]POV03604.1 hypothetical protein C3424_20325 [Citrobacter amalonaticus]